MVVVLTDGRATSGGSDPLSAATAAAQRLAAAVDEMVIVDTEVGYPRLGLAGELARSPGAHHMVLEAVGADGLGRELVARLVDGPR